MAGERKKLIEYIGRENAENAGDELWQFDPAPFEPKEPNSISHSIFPPKDLSDEPELRYSEHFDADLLVSRGELPFSAEEVGRATALRFYVEGRFFDLRDSFSRALSREYELGNQFNFVPVILALGIGAYYSIASEPNFVALGLTLVCLAGILFRIKSRGGTYRICIFGFLFIAGMTAAKIQMDRAVMPVPLSQLTGQVIGVVKSVDQNRRGVPRYLIAPLAIDGLHDDELPKLIRLSASKKHAPFSPGDGIKGLARLQPVSGPAYPGSYDFAFSAYLQGLGLSGFFMGSPEAIPSQPRGGLLVSASLRLQSFRGNISERIRNGLPGEAGDIAVALITGDRSGLSDETQESLRRSGLAHILAISGLHMALVTLTIIWLVRLILVMVPNLADHYPIKKWAIAAGFVTATLYLFISGASIATQRAWLMISVMLAASFMDRRALTMRSVTIAALIILLVSPASLFQPGFQMSFAAVAALVVVYQDWTRFNQRRRKVLYEPKASWLRQISGYFAGLSATSLIAGFATALIAMAHFHRVAPMGLISNLVAMPLVSMFVMPLSLLSMFLMPYGFEGLALAPLGKAIEGVVDVANWVNSYQFDFETGDRPSVFLLFSGAFLILGCFLRTRLRLFALVPLVGLIGIAGSPVPLPDMLIGQDGRSIAVRSALFFPQGAKEAGEGLSLLYPRSGKFTTDIWQKAFLPNKAFDALPDTIACTKDRCDFQFGEKKVYVVFDPKLLQAACKIADILIAPRLWWVNCRGKKPELIINRSDLEANGSYQLALADGKISIKTAWPAVSALKKRRIWEQRFNNIARRYPSYVPFEQGPPRRRGLGIGEIGADWPENEQE